MTQETTRISGLDELDELTDDVQFIVDDPSDTTASKRVPASTVADYAGNGNGGGGDVDNDDIDARIATWARANSPSGTIPDTSIPSTIMRDSEFTAAAVRNLLGLTEDEVNETADWATHQRARLDLQTCGRHFPIAHRSGGGRRGDR